VIAELEKCQDQVPAFSGEEAVRIVESTWGESVDSLFLSFDIEPLASASVAQVHAARLHDGTDVVVKILRPKIKKTIQEDIALMYHLATWVRWRWPGSHRLRLHELVGEFEHTILNELDLVREAANAAQLRRNFSGSTMMMVPQVYWQFIKPNIMVSERVFGVRISDVKTLHERDVNMKRLAEHGVIIFFTQVFCSH
jgi:ubiquinone biosynthesis protein